MTSLVARQPRQGCRHPMDRFGELRLVESGEAEPEVRCGMFIERVAPTGMECDTSGCGLR